MSIEADHGIHFDATLDEIVEVNLRLTTRTKTYRACRARAVWVSGGCLAVSVLAMLLIRSRASEIQLPAGVWSALVAAALALGCGFGYLYGRYIDWAMRRQYKRIVAEQLGGRGDVRCEIELRSEGVWVQQKGLEMTFSWRNATGVEDTGDAIELRFNPGLVVARNRAFRDEAARAGFLERARQLARDVSARQAP